MKKSLLAVAIITAIAGCTSNPKTGYLDASAPKDAVLVVMPGEMIVSTDEATVLPVGEYQLETRRFGYHPLQQPFVITEENTTIVAGKSGVGFAPVSFSVTPPEALVLLNGELLSQGSWKGELDVGEYELSVTLENYYPQEQNLAIEPGKAVSLNVELKSTPVRADLKLSAPANASIYFKDKKLGVQTASLQQLPPGNYSYTAIKPVDDVTRFIGIKSFRVQTRGNFTVTLETKQKQRFFEGQWHDQGKAVDLEQARFDKQSVTNPVATVVELDENTLNQWRNTPSLAEYLHTVLRVGDRIIMQKGSGRWDIWKRHHEMTRDFQAVVDSFANNRSLPEVVNRSGSIQPTLTLTDVNLEQMALVMHRSRNPFALLDLNAGQLPDDAIEIRRSKADGEITLLATGTPPTIANKEWQTVGQLSLLRLSAKDEAIQVQWTEAPGQLLAVSDTVLNLPELQDEELKQQQKQAVVFNPEYDISKINRLTVNPQNTSHWETFDRTGPLGGMLDLSRDEIGPHNQAGNYLRVWLLTLDNNGATQRQISQKYHVIDKTRVAESREFLRRSRLDKE